MNPIFGSIVNGEDPEKILEYLVSKMPKMAKRVSRAKKQGHSTSHILDFLSSQMSRKSEGAIKPLAESKEKAEKEQDQMAANLLKQAASAGTMLAAAKFLPTTMTALGKRFPKIATLLGEGEAVAGAGAVEGAVGQAAKTAIPEQLGAGLEGDPRRMFDFLDKRNLTERLNKLVQKGKSKEEIVDFLKKKLPLMDQEYLRTIGFTGETGEIDERLSEMAELFTGVRPDKEGLEITGEEEIIPEAPVEPEQAVEEADITLGQEEPEKKPRQLEKGSRVLTEEGDFAEIENIPGKAAKVDIEGQKKVIDKEGLIPIPENEEEIEDLYKRLLDKIPEGEKSRMADYIGYNPDGNELQVIFQNGASYIYDDVPEEIVSEIVNSDFMAKTTGGNYIGNWYKGAPSIGAGVSQLIRDLQEARGGKGKEYSKKFAELYSLHRYPKQKLKEKYEREKKAKKKKKV